MGNDLWQYKCSTNYRGGVPEVSTFFYRSILLTIETPSRWATQRQEFGKSLILQPVIRSKLAAMITRIESAQSWLENVTHQMNNMNYRQQSNNLAGYA